MPIQPYATGAALVLSILNTIALILRNRPLAILEPWPSESAPANRLQIRMINPGDQPVQIAGLFFIPTRGNLNVASANNSVGSAGSPAYRTLSHKIHGTFYQFIGPKSEHVFKVSRIERLTLLVFVWHRNRVVNIRVPLLRLISPTRSAIINQEYPDIPI